MERHAQSILALIMAGLITWVGSSIMALNETTAALRGDVRIANERIESVQQQIRLANDDRYRASQAAADFKLRDQRIEDNTRRIVDLESKRGR